MEEHAVKRLKLAISADRAVASDGHTHITRRHKCVYSGLSFEQLNIGGGSDFSLLCDPSQLPVVLSLSLSFCVFAAFLCN